MSWTDGGNLFIRLVRVENTCAPTYVVSASFNLLQVFYTEFLDNDDFRTSRFLVLADREGMSESKALKALKSNQVGSNVKGLEIWVIRCLYQNNS